MTIYLYVKTHNKTGLKYLGKTVQNPHTYKGSGVYWTNHIKTHGYDVTTEILRECSSEDELKYWGEYYSNLWNIVEDCNSDGKKTWANIIPELGQGAGYGEENISHLPEVKQKKAEKRNRPGYIDPMSLPENKKKISDTHWSKIHPEVREKVSGDNHYTKKLGYESKLKGNKNPFRNPAVIQKRKDTLIERYGVNNPMKSSDIVSKVSGDNHYSRKENFVSPISGDNHYTKKSDFVSKTSGSNHYTKRKDWTVEPTNKNFDHTIYEWTNRKTREVLFCDRRHMMELFNLKAPSICALIKGDLKSYKGWTVRKK